ncbi:MAG: hypothetical protein NVSMB21_07820 [Vulcanimicrobiaceae bacterium]
MDDIPERAAPVPQVRSKAALPLVPILITTIALGFVIGAALSLVGHGPSGPVAAVATATPSALPTTPRIAARAPATHATPRATPGRSHAVGPSATVAAAAAAAAVAARARPKPAPTERRSIERLELAEPRLLCSAIARVRLGKR